MKTTALALLAFTALQILAARAEEKPADKPAPDQEITVASYYFGNYQSAPFIFTLRGSPGW